MIKDFVYQAASRCRGTRPQALKCEPEEVLLTSDHGRRLEKAGMWGNRA